MVKRNRRFHATQSSRCYSVKEKNLLLTFCRFLTFQCIYTHIHVCACAYPYIYVHTHLCVCVCVCVCTCVYVCIHSTTPPSFSSPRLVTIQSLNPSISLQFPHSKWKIDRFTHLPKALA